MLSPECLEMHSANFASTMLCGRTRRSGGTEHLLANIQLLRGRVERDRGKARPTGEMNIVTQILL